MKFVGISGSFRPSIAWLQCSCILLIQTSLILLLMLRWFHSELPFLRGPLMGKISWSIQLHREDINGRWMSLIRPSICSAIVISLSRSMGWIAMVVRY